MTEYKIPSSTVGAKSTSSPLPRSAAKGTLANRTSVPSGNNMVGCGTSVSKIKVPAASPSPPGKK